MRNKIIVTSVIVLCCLVGFLECTKPLPSTLKLGYLPIAECTPLFVGKTENIFEKHGLNVELTEFDAGPTVIAASLGGSLDGGLSGVTPIFLQ